MNRSSGSRFERSSVATKLLSKFRTAMKKKSPVVTVGSGRAKSFVPCLRDYLYYTGILSRREDRTVISAELPPISQEAAIFREIRSNFADSVEGFDDEARERFVLAIGKIFDANHRSSTRIWRRQLKAQWSCKRWRDAYLGDCRLGSFDTHSPPMIVRVSFGKEPEDGSFVRMARRFHLKVVKFDTAHILTNKCQIRNNENSLTTANLRRLGAQSVFYRRIYLLQTLLYILAHEGLSILTEDKDARVLFVVDAKLEPLLRLNTAISIILHGNANVSFLYM